MGRTGDWEGDAVAGRRGGACLVTQVDGMGGHLVGGKAARKAHTEASEATERALEGGAVHTVTLDRGKEFSDAEGLQEALGAPVCFCHPTIHGSGAPTSTPMAFSGTGSRRARASTMSATARCRRHTIHSIGDNASVSGGSAPGRSITASRCTCSEDSPPNT